LLQIDFLLLRSKSTISSFNPTSISYIGGGMRLAVQ
jgi:hypothetical protein